MKKDLLYHSFYIRRPRNKTFTDKMFIYKIDDKGYYVYSSEQPKNYKLFILPDDYEKYVNTLSACDGTVKIVKHKPNTIEKKLQEIKELEKETIKEK